MQGEVEGERLEGEALQLDFEAGGLGEAGAELGRGQPGQHQAGEDGVESQGEDEGQGEAEPPPGGGGMGWGGGWGTRVGHGIGMEWMRAP